MNTYIEVGNNIKFVCQKGQLRQGRVENLKKCKNGHTVVTLLVGVEPGTDQPRYRSFNMEKVSNLQLVS